MKVTITCGRKFHSDHLGAALLRLGALERIVTANPRMAYRRHEFPEGRVQHTFPFYVPGLVAGRISWLQSLGARMDWMASRLFDRAAASRLGNPDVVIGWAWSTLRTFQDARRREIRCVLEECGSANAHQEILLSEEHERLGLKRRTGVGQAVIDNERAECDAADLILCPSRYVADSFAIYGVSAERCVVLPYASNPKFQADAPKQDRGKLKILYVGSVGARKGIIYLFRALAQLPKGTWECTVIGRVDPDFETIFARHSSLVRHIPSVPHERMPDYFREANVFVLPTLDEGMAYVVMEALASGTPVITTAHSGAVGKVIDGQNGFIVPIRDEEAIARCLTELSEDTGMRESMSAAALLAAGSWSWDEYAGQLLEILSKQFE